MRLNVLEFKRLTRYKIFEIFLNCTFFLFRISENRFEDFVIIDLLTRKNSFIIDS